MKIRDKFFLVFGLYIFLTVIFGYFAYRELRTISTRLLLVERADDITNTILEVRRYEKNFLLFKDRESFDELQKYLGTFKNNIDTVKAEIALEIDSRNTARMKQSIAEYEHLISVISENFAEQKELEEVARAKGRKTERTLVNRELEIFLVLRRYEKNVMLYKNQGAYEDFKRSFESSSLLSHPDIQEYEALVTKLYLLYDSEKETIEKIRMTARSIQSFTQNLSKHERLSIDATITMAITLLVTALVVIIIVGTIINLKFATSITTPISTLEKITKKIALGDFSESIRVKGKDELASLEASFNLMEEKLKDALWSLEHTIEKLREKQAQLVEAEKLASVGRLAAGIAHEINNPLTSVLTFSHLILEECSKDNPWCEKLKIMVRETERARNIVRQLLNFGRDANIKPVKININQPVEEIMDSLVAQEAFKEIKLSVNLGEKLPDVYVDPAQIGQVVLNLALNAIHSIIPPGKIEVSTRVVDKFVAIIVHDTGSGIAPEHLGKIFDPFFTTKDATKGTGLGLAVSYGIIKKHGGDIEVESVMGKGTTFTVKVPING
jgi:signal transduction histidine kinase